jgi:hypothetical protein
MRRALPDDRRTDALGKSVRAFLEAFYPALILVGKSDGPPRLHRLPIARNGLSSVDRYTLYLLFRLRRRRDAGGQRKDGNNACDCA